MPDAEAASALFWLGQARASTAERFQMQAAIAYFTKVFDYYDKTGDVERAVAVAEYPGHSLAFETGMDRIVVRALALVQPDTLQAARLLSAHGAF